MERSHASLFAEMDGNLEMHVEAILEDLPLADCPLVDYSESFPGALAAHAAKDQVLILYPVDRPYRRVDGKTVRYELENRWLSRTAKPDTDDYVCVQGSEVSLWTAAEAKQLVRAAKCGDSLFKHVSLF